MRRAMCLEATEREALATDARSTSRSASLIGRKVVCCGGGGPSQLFMGGPDLVSLSSTARGVRDDAVKMWIPVQVQQFFGCEQGWESTRAPLPRQDIRPAPPAQAGTADTTGGYISSLNSGLKRGLHSV